MVTVDSGPERYPRQPVELDPGIWSDGETRWEVETVIQARQAKTRGVMCTPRPTDSPVLS